MASEKKPLLAVERSKLPDKRGANGLSTTPQCIAHRGYSARFPENTMAAFRAAAKAGAHAIETDLHLSADGVVVLSHDATLKRCFGIKRRLDECDWSYLRTLRTLREPRQPMPCLSELLEFLAEEGREDMWLLLDVKMDDDAEELMTRTAQAIASMPPSKSRPWDERIIIGCWNEAYLSIARSHFPTHPLSYINISTHYARSLRGTPDLTFNLHHLTLASPCGATFLRSARAAGHPVFVWTVNTRRWMEWALDAGLDGLITDEVDLFLELTAAPRRAPRPAGPGRVWRRAWLTAAHLLAAPAVTVFSTVGGYGGVTRRPKQKS